MTQDQNIAPGRFARSICCEDSGNGQFISELPEGWDIMGNANGGHMMAMAANAMLSHCGRADPVTLTAHFLKPGRSGTHVTACETVKEGKAFATVRANMDKDGVPVLTLVGAFGQLAPVSQTQLLVDAEPPTLPRVGGVARLPCGFAGTGLGLPGAGQAPKIRGVPWPYHATAAPELRLARPPSRCL